MTIETLRSADSGPFKTYQDAVADGQFILQQCKECGQHVFYPRILCNHCGSTTLKWVEACGRGIIYSVSIIRQRPEKGGDYNVTLIDLEEGPRMMTRIVGLDLDKIKIGMEVIAHIGSIDDKPAVLFSPKEGEGEW